MTFSIIDEGKDLNELIFHVGAIVLGVSGIGLVIYGVAFYIRSTKLKARLDLEYGEDN